jgi:NTE family protein
MGAVVGAAYALRSDWYDALLDFAEAGLRDSRLGATLPPHLHPSKLRQMTSGAKTMWNLGHGWGAGTEAVATGRSALSALLGRADLSDGRLPIAVSATDLLSGERVVLRTGSAAEAVYASSALAGVLPPERKGPWLLADGAYTDVCPIDVARELGQEVTVAVNPGRSDLVEEIQSGLHALLRATEICYLHHSALRFADADIVIRPPYRRAIDTLDFGAYRECIAAGIRGVRRNTGALARAVLRQ